MTRKDIFKHDVEGALEGLFEIFGSALIYALFAFLHAFLIVKFFPLNDDSIGAGTVLVFSGLFTFLFSYVKLILNEIISHFKIGGFSELQYSFIMPLVYGLVLAAGVYFLSNPTTDLAEYRIAALIFGVIGTVILYCTPHNQVASALETYGLFLIFAKDLDEYSKSARKIKILTLILSAFSWIPAFVLIHYEFTIKYILMSCAIAFAFFVVVNLIVNSFTKHEDEILEKLGVYDDSKTNYYIQEVKNAGVWIYNFIAPLANFLVLYLGYKNFSYAAIGAILLYINHISYREFERKYKITGRTTYRWSDGEVDSVTTYEENKDD